MRLAIALQELGYSDSPAFMRESRFAGAPDVAHIFRRAAQSCRLVGVYALGAVQDQPGDRVVPVVYVCQADSIDEADGIHKLVWNQNVVPFLIVLLPDVARVYCGFEPPRAGPRGASPVLVDGVDCSSLATRLESLTAAAIDSGEVWKRLGHRVRPEKRVDRRLLESLSALDVVLQGKFGIDPLLSHCLIGKYVYLCYLRQRQILSDSKLQEWELSPADIYSRHATQRAFREVCERTEQWLNGSLFPISARELASIGTDTLRLVAAVFSGDSIDGQLHLPFDAYEFSHIPIETLSVIYEQFLHTRSLGDQSGTRTAGEQQAAYYTPVPVVNFIIDRLHERRPLLPGMRVIDPACGSGAFLVQCYRRMIEAHMRTRDLAHPSLTELRSLLTSSIFGIDSDEDACRVAEFSLILTLLDYARPPDLSSRPQFKLPALRGSNIIHGHSLDDHNGLVGSLKKLGFDWIIGNPPWKDVDEGDRATSAWMSENSDCPVGGRQLAELFVWRSLQLASNGSVVGLLLPAATLFKYESREFRATLAARADVWYVANFSNMARVLFGGDPEAPAAALFISPLGDEGHSIDSSGKHVTVFSPFVANQIQQIPGDRARRRQPTWSITINAAEVRYVPYTDIDSGDALPWKIAMWGSVRDQRLLQKLSRKYKGETFGDWESRGILTISEGMQLREAPREGGEALEHHPELANKPILDIGALRRERNLFAFPPEAIRRVPSERTWVRAGRFAIPYAVSQPPHVIVHAARNWAVYSPDVLIVPPRQIGIRGSSTSAALLKAVALYLGSDFVRYHQFLTSPEFGTKRARSTLSALRSIPLPIDAFSRDLSDWESLHGQFVRAFDPAAQGILREQDSTVKELQSGVNELVAAALGLDRRARALINDLIHVRLRLDDGKRDVAALEAPNKPELTRYATFLRDDLDEFVASLRNIRVAVRVYVDQATISAEVETRRTRGGAIPVTIGPADPERSKMVANLRDIVRSAHPHWRYYNRNLQLFGLRDNTVCIVKPAERISWLPSEALRDSSSIVAETLSQVKQKDGTALRDEYSCS